jgi:hypothetical protein
LRAEHGLGLNDARLAAAALVDHCRTRGWAGWDPYDTLNSRVLGRALVNRPVRLLVTQLAKRSPVNLRPVLGVPRVVNPKALALFITAFTEYLDLGFAQEDLPVTSLIDRLLASRSPHPRHHAWGYPFPWQTRTTLVPRDAPNLVTTCFAANALLDAYEHGHGSHCLAAATSAAEYLLEDLYVADSTGVGFRYPTPSSAPVIHNANLLASAVLARVYGHTGRRALVDAALRVARNACAHQRLDGSWYYADSPHYRWIDNFHTGYNLCALQAIGRDAAVDEFDPHIGRGLAFYLEHFFRDDGAPRYFPTRDYPVDIHCVAQSIITLITLRDSTPDWRERVHSIFAWAMTRMWDPRGFFYYRVHRTATIRIDYIRWAQAWMSVALALFLKTIPPASPR